jgi:hypothetical protein
MGRIDGLAWNSASIRKVLGRWISDYMSRATIDFIARRDRAGVARQSELWRSRRCMALGGVIVVYLEWYRGFDGFIVYVGAITL